MALARIIEYLLTLRLESGSRICNQGFAQVRAVIPPRQRITLQFTPSGNDYAIIVYQSTLDPLMIPGAFHFTSQYFGDRPYDAVLDAYLLANSSDGFSIISKAIPSIATIENLTPLNQFFSGVNFFLDIKSDADYALIVKTLAKLDSFQAQNLGARMDAVRQGGRL